MRSIIQRSQSEVKGMLGGSKGFNFTLQTRLELTEDERAVVERYRLHQHPVTYRSVQGTQIPAETIASLMQGVSQTVQSVEVLLRNEDVIKSACDQLPPLFDVISSFGESEIVEYPRTAG